MHAGSPPCVVTTTQCMLACLPSNISLYLLETWALFSSQKILQNFSDFSSHRIFRHMKH
jgi:hypothetical protein